MEEGGDIGDEYDGGDADYGENVPILAGDAEDIVEYDDRVGAGGAGEPNGDAPEGGLFETTIEEKEEKDEDPSAGIEEEHIDVPTDIRKGARILVPRHASKYERARLIELMINSINSGSVLDRRIIAKAQERFPHDDYTYTDALNLATVAIDMALDPDIRLDLGIYLDRPTTQGFEAYELKDLPPDPVRYGTLNLESLMLQKLGMQ